MGARDLHVIDRSFLAILWVGMLGFIVLHSLLLFTGGIEQTVSLIRIVWFGGLGVLTVMIALSAIRN
jgi:hypothetical protein